MTEREFVDVFWTHSVSCELVLQKSVTLRQIDLIGLDCIFGEVSFERKMEEIFFYVFLHGLCSRVSKVHTVKDVS